MSEFDQLLQRLDSLLDRVEQWLPSQPHIEIRPDCRAYRWTDDGMEGITQWDQVDEAELLHLHRQKNLMMRNTAQFIAGKPANNALLWGARGTGKSSLIKAQLTAFKQPTLCVVEVPRAATHQLFQIIRRLAREERKFIIYLDDLSFEAQDDSYKALKACLEGSLQAQPDNVLIYATSNRRHLMPESMKDNLDSRMVDGQLHPSDSIEEKVSLSDRFGLWLSFHPFTQDQYLAVVELALKKRGLCLDEEARAESLRFATARGSRSGRIATQFAAYWETLVD